jgi:hypothetical protein
MYWVLESVHAKWAELDTFIYSIFLVKLKWTIVNFIHNTLLSVRINKVVREIMVFGHTSSRFIMNLRDFEVYF